MSRVVQAAREGLADDRDMQTGGVSLRLFRRNSYLNLALQGGGAHGAFTWGVLDRLLEDGSLEIGWISGTSAGAVNAVALAAGLADGGREAARRKLREVWEAVAKARVPDLLRLNPILYGLSTSNTMAQVASLWSPYEFNPLGLDPFRQLLEQTIDFKRVREASPVELLIAATDITTGQARIFRRHEMTVEAVLASACLPTVHRTVEIEGRGYWDGGFSKNPDLVTLALDSPYEDTLLVQINPIIKAELPTGAREIAGAVNRLTFNQPLMREIELIEAVRETALGRPFGGRGRYDRLLKQRYHLIDAGRYTSSLPDDSKMRPDMGLLTYLHGAGQTQAHKWLGLNRDAVGQRSTVDLAARFLRPEADDASQGPPKAGDGKK